MRFSRKTSLLATLLVAGLQQVSCGQSAVGDASASRVPVQFSSSSTPALPRPDAVLGAADSVRRERSKRSATTKPPSPGCFFLNARSFTIPFTVDAAGAQPREVQLLSSRGPTSAWRRIDGKPAVTDEKVFQFSGEEDGEFWFATRTIDSNGRPHPQGPVKPQLKVFVDTTKPDASLDVDADASGRVDVTLSIHDDTPLTLKLRYVTDADRVWRDIDVAKVQAGGRLQINPPANWDQLSLQLVATDAAKNQRIVAELVNRPRIAEAPRSRLAASSSDDPLQATSAQYRMEGESAPAQTVADTRPTATTSNPPLGPSTQMAAHGHTFDPATGRHSGLNAFRGAVPTPPAAPATIQNSASQLPVQHRAAVAAQAAPAAAEPPPVPAKPHVSAARSIYAVPRYSQPYQAAPQPPGVGASPYATSPPYAAPSPNAVSTPHAGGMPAGMNGVALPAPASPSQITQGFAMPTRPYGANTIGAAQRLQSAAGGESIPTPAGSPAPSLVNLNAAQGGGPMPQTTAAAEASSAAARPRPKTAAEAMRPLTPTRPDAGGATESVPTPTPEMDLEPRRRSARKPVEPTFNPDLAPTRYSDSVRFSLEFEVESIGSNGVDGIELYGSTDGGQTWRFWGEDPDRVSPFDIEVKEQGAFGFRIVVVGSNGLTSPRPQPGETPDIVVVVDHRVPVVRISGAQYGEGDRTGSLVIRYECNDLNLTERPIALSFSDNLDGPWTTIAAGLRNEGGYVWPADPGLPRQIYLRVDATDQAGNVGTHVLDRPIDVQGLAPRARIRGFQSLSGTPSVAPGGQKTARRPTPTLKK